MFAWSGFPFLRITFFLILGILVARYSEVSADLNILSFVILPGFLFLLAIIRKKLDNAIVGLLILISIASIGSFRYASRNQMDKLPRYTNQLSQTKAYLGKIISYPSYKNDRVSVRLALSEILNDSTSQSCNATVLVTINPVAKFRYGDKLIISGAPSRIPEPKNPGAFDFARFMADQNIFFQDFVSQRNVKIVNRNSGNPILSAVYNLRKHLENTIVRHVVDPEARGIALAILLGIRDELSNETQKNFASTGAMHVLAVSGLHVGIIYLAVLSMFKLFPYPVVKNWLSPIICLFILWFYALLTGFSPSIFRAVTMFSVIIIGQHMQRTPNIYNSIAVSAFVLLLTNPFNLFSVGFQLSYIAVIGIVALYKPIYQLISVPTWLGDKIWSLLCVSLAAQISTTPISIYYFHQFPSYFWLTNILVIPMAFVIMTLGLTLLSFGHWSFMDWLGMLFESSLQWLIRAIDLIASLPWSKLNWLHLSLGQVLFLYAFLGITIAFFYFKKSRYMWLSFTLLMLNSFTGLSSLIWQLGKEYTVFYSLPNAATRDDINGIRGHLTSVDSVISEQTLNQIAPFRLKNHLPKPYLKHSLHDTQYWIEDFAKLDISQGTRYVYLDAPITSRQVEVAIETDVLVVSHNAIRTVEELEGKINFGQLILDNTCTPKLAKHIISESNTKGYNVSYLREGAVILAN